MGRYVCNELLRHGKHVVTAITRPNSSSTIPEGVKKVVVDQDDESSLVAAMEGQDFLMITLNAGLPQIETHEKLVHAARKAKIRYVMPNLYGPDFVANEKLLEKSLVGGFSAKMVQQVRDAGLTPIVLICGFWYEWSLGVGPMAWGFDLQKRCLTIVDDGNTKTNTSTWLQCGRAVAALLDLKIFPDDANDHDVTLSRYFDQYVYIDSFLVSQREMFESMKRVTGTTDADWTITQETAEARYADAVATLTPANPASRVKGMYTSVWFKGAGGDYTSKGMQNEALGLPKEDLDEATKRTFELIEKGEIPQVHY